MNKMISFLKFVSIIHIQQFSFLARQSRHHYISMFRVLTQDIQEHKISEQTCNLYNGFYYIASDQTQSVAQIYHSIAQQYFQAELPPIVLKITKMVVDSLTIVQSLTIYRQIMELIRNQSHLITLCKNYLIAMNQAIDQGSSNSMGQNCKNQNMRSFDEVVKKMGGEIEVEKTILQKRNMKVYSELQTMRTEILDGNEGSFINMYESSITKYGCLSIGESSAKQLSKNEDIDSSFELQNYERKGKSVLDNKIQNLIRESIHEEIKRQLFPKVEQSKNTIKQQVRYKRMIKDRLMNAKLKLKKKN